MAERAAAATWVEIRRVLLEPDERAPQLPDDTRRVPLELRVKGFLVAAARVGGPAEIVTPAGRRLRGPWRYPPFRIVTRSANVKISCMLCEI